ncbi:Putative zinc- or iron-chelating domain protein [uncultured archaeon]|nr:Putative zinc- or iron-chelating domain protein [uncultured archaeon]
MNGFECLRCGECCRRYYIVSLPEEVERQAELVKIPGKDFVHGKMQLYLQLFPAEPSGDKITVTSKDLPKRLYRKIENALGFMPSNFIALPLLCFKRTLGSLGCCIFYDSKKGCTIYPARPKECCLFPFISLKESADYATLYPFCKGLAASHSASYAGMGHASKAKEHFAEVAEHLGEVKEKGFKKIWKYWPKSGVCLLEGNFLCKISEKDFFAAIKPYS